MQLDVIPQELRFVVLQAQAHRAGGAGALSGAAAAKPARPFSCANIWSVSREVSAAGEAFAEMGGLSVY